MDWWPHKSHPVTHTPRNSEVTSIGIRDLVLRDRQTLGGEYGPSIEHPNPQAPETGWSAISRHLSVHPNPVVHRSGV
jgi:hypothetical protein